MSASALSSSRDFQVMNFSMSGWSMSRQTILAARRVVPPLLMASALRSRPRRKLMTPLDTPPPESFSPSARKALKFEPVPEPPLKSFVSVTYSSEMEWSPRSLSWTLTMKQALAWVRVYWSIDSTTSPLSGST